MVTYVPLPTDVVATLIPESEASTALLQLWRRPDGDGWCRVPVIFKRLLQRCCHCELPELLICPMVAVPQPAEHSLGELPNQ